MKSVIDAPRTEAPLCSKNLKISLRGGLAEEYLQLRDGVGSEASQQFLEEIVMGADSSLCQRIEHGMVVIGRYSDLGKYLPDW